MSQQQQAPIYWVSPNGGVAMQQQQQQQQQRQPYAGYPAGVVYQQAQMQQQQQGIQPGQAYILTQQQPPQQQFGGAPNQPFVVYQMPTVMRAGPGGVLLPAYPQQPQILVAPQQQQQVFIQAAQQPQPQQQPLPPKVQNTTPTTKQSNGCCGGHKATPALTNPDDYVTDISFTVNGVPYTVTNVDPTVSLNDWIRAQPGLTGTKKSCGEGGCGACVVSMSWSDEVTGQNTNVSVNSCLRPLATMDGANVTTIEGLGSVESGLHPLQEKIAQWNGTQCGFCTPGMIMRMYTLLESTPNPTPAQVEAAFDGNLCRCTGYRPILDAFKTFCADSGDIEDLVSKVSLGNQAKGCKSGCAKPCSKRETGGCSKDKKKFKFQVKGATNQIVWFSAATLDDVFTIFQQYNGSAIMLVVGNTSTGIYKDVPVDVYCDIRGIPQLTTSSVDPTNGITIGAANTITEFIELLTSVLANNQTYQTSGLPVVIKHLYRIANWNVRNVGSVAGNIMLAHNNQFFPSDLFLVLLSVGAQLTVATSSTTTDVVPADQFMQYDMTNKVLMSITVPYLLSGEQLQTYKVAIRHENSHAFVNAGFRIQLDSNYNVLSQPTIAYGGIGPFASRATNTEQFLVGKTLTDPTVLQQALPILGQEMVAQAPLKQAYCQSLVFSYFYKFYLSMIPSSLVSPQNLSATVPFVRPVSVGQVSYATDPEQYPVSEAIPKIEANIQCTGEAQYIDDIPAPSNIVHAAYVLATIPVGDIVSVDPSAALAAPGVVSYISASDIPKAGQNNCQWDWLLPPGAEYVEPVFATTSVLFYGQPIGLVIADTAAHAHAASLLVNVTYANVGTPLITIQDAMAASSYWSQSLIIPPITQGDINQGFSNSDIVFSGEIGCGSQYHFHMETQSSYAIPEDNGTISLWSSTQWGAGIQTGVANVLGLPAAKVTVNNKRVGGAYGAKLTRAVSPATAAAVAAWKLRRPVRLVMDITSNMNMIGKRDNFYAQYKIGANTNGLINAVEITYYGNGGAILDGTAINLMMAMLTCDNTYNFANISVNGICCKTNVPGNTFMRAPGCLPAIFFAEQIIEHTATMLNLPSDQVREINFYKSGQVTPYKQPLPYFNIPTIWSQLKASANWNERVQQVQAFNTANRWTKQGISLTPCKYGIQWNNQNFHCMVNIFSDGSVQVSCGGIEMGQGLNTKVAQVCAQTLGVPFSLVSIAPFSTEKSPNSAMTGGSIGSDLNSVAVQMCCQTLNQRLAGLQQLFVKENFTWEQLIAKAVAAGIDLQATSWTNRPTPNIYTYNSYGAAVTQVQVDVLTGETQILRSDLLFDCGISINPAVDIGQTQGAFVQGIGYFLTEEIVYDPSNPGVLITNGTWEYKPPSSTDIPIDFRIALLKDAPNPLGVVNSKASGEPPMTLASSVFFAVKDAIASARSDAGLTGYFEFNAPATVDNIQQSAGTTNAQLTF